MVFNRDENGFPINKATAFQCIDSTPQSSPIATGTTVVTIVWPPGALSLLIHPIEFALKLLSSSDGYITIDAGTWFEIPGKAGDKTQLDRGAGTTSLEFVFQTLK